MNVVQYLNQGEIYVAHRGLVLRISAMSQNQRVTAAKWLIKHATPLIATAEAHLDWTATQHERDTDTFQLSNIIVLMSQGPRKWLVTSTLYQALIKDVPAEVLVSSELVA